MLPVQVRRLIPYAKFPENYQAACKAMEACLEFDEVKEWSNKAAMMAAYAKQAENKSMLTMAEKIIVRAEQRIGEFLNELAAGKTLKEVAADAKMSSHRAGIARTLTKIPKEKLDQAMDKMQERITPARVAYQFRSARASIVRQRKLIERTPDEVMEDAYSWGYEQISELEEISDPAFTQSNELNWADAVLGCSSPEEAMSLSKRLFRVQENIALLASKYQQRAIALIKLDKPYLREDIQKSKNENAP